MYVKTQWVDNTTPIDKDNLNKIEQGIYDNSLVVDAVTNTINPTDIETYKTAELTEGQITDVIGVSDIIIKGQTSQNGEPTSSSPVDVNVVSGSNVINTSNKNLLDISNLNTQTQNGVTIIKNKDNSITLNGTSTSAITIDVLINEITLKENTTYVFSKNTNIAGASYALSLRESNNTHIDTTSLDSSAKSLNINLSTKKIAKYFRLYIVNGKTFTNHTFYPMLELGETETTYKLHQGKELHLDLPVENLLPTPYLNSEGYQSGIKFKENFDGSYSIIGTATSDVFLNFLRDDNKNILKDNTTYSLSGGNSLIQLYFNGASGFDTGTGYTFTYTESMGNTRLIGAKINKGTTVNQTIFPMLVKGNKPQGYTPYGVKEIELCKIGNYQDYFYKRGSKWYLHKEINKITSYNGETITTSYISTTGELSTGAKVYYVVNSTNTEITNTTLISQLEAIYNVPLYEQTNITQTNNDLPMVLDITACKDNINGIKAFIRK